MKRRHQDRTGLFAALVALIIALVAVGCGGKGEQAPEDAVAVAPARAEQKGQVPETPAVAPTAMPEPQPQLPQAAAPPAGPNAFVDGVGRYPSEARLLESGPVAQRLEKLAGADFAALKERLQVETPIRLLEERFYFTSGCMPHMCGGDDAAVLYDAANDNLWIGLRKDEKLETRSEKPIEIFPAEAETWRTGG